MENYENGRVNNGNEPESKNGLLSKNNKGQEKNKLNGLYLENDSYKIINKNDDLNENLNINKIQNNNIAISKKRKNRNRYNTYKINKNFNKNLNLQNKRELNEILNNNSSKSINKEERKDINKKDNNENKSILSRALKNNSNLFFNKVKNLFITDDKEDNKNNKNNIDDNKGKNISKEKDLKYNKKNMRDLNINIDDNKNDIFFNNTSKNFYSNKKEFNKPINGVDNKKENINEKEDIKKIENKKEKKELNSHEKKDEENIKYIFTYAKKQLNKRFSFQTYNPKELNQKNYNEINNNIKNNKNGNENYEINDNSENLNINEITNQKNKEKSKPIINNINKNNNKYNTNYNEKDEIINKYSMKKMRSFSDLNKNLSKKPNYLNIFDKINIFNSILIIQNNINSINKCLEDNKKIELIKECQNKNSYCLTSILYYMNKFLWNSSIRGISRQDLLKKYTDFINCYIKVNCKDKNKEKYCYDIKNTEAIIDFIYSKINNEYSQAKKNSINNNEYSQAKENSINNKDFENKKDALSTFMYDFSKKNKSFISDNFYGFTQKISICENCHRKQCFYNMQFKPEYEYDTFCYINFDINKIINFCNSFPKFQINNKNHDFNLDNCFNYYLNQIFKIKEKLYCNSCFTFSKSEKLSIYSLPKILTLILSNNNNNFNFVLQDEIFLKKYTLNSSDDSKYNLISILCQLNFNDKFILYTFNHKDELWYSYTDGKITQVENMDINAIPLVLFYQAYNTMKFKYKILKKEEKILVYVHFTNGIKKALFFSKNVLIIQVRRFLSTYFNLNLNKINLIVNGEKPHDYKFLKGFLKNNNNNILIYVNE